jgi:hypothetical protein
VPVLATDQTQTPGIEGRIDWILALGKRTSLMGFADKPNRLDFDAP